MYQLGLLAPPALFLELYTSMLQLGREFEARLPAPGTEVGPSTPAPPPNPQRLPSLPSLPSPTRLARFDQAITPSRYLTSTPASFRSLLNADDDSDESVAPTLPDFGGKKE